MDLEAIYGLRRDDAQKSFVVTIEAFGIAPRLLRLEDRSVPQRPAGVRLHTQSLNSLFSISAVFISVAK